MDLPLCVLDLHDDKGAETIAAYHATSAAAMARTQGAWLPQWALFKAQEQLVEVRCPLVSVQLCRISVLG